MSISQNFVEWLLEAADPTATAIVDHEREVSFRTLSDEVRRVAAFIRTAHRGRERPIVPIVGESSVEWIGAYLGVLYAGAVAAPVPLLAPAALAHVFAETSPAVVLASGDIPAGVRELGVPVISIRDIPTMSGIDAAVELDPDALAVLLYTSGSTGRPRGVMLSTRNLRANAEAIQTFCPLRRDDRALAVLPFYYCYGASVLHTHLRAGASVAFPRSSFHADILDALARTGATGLPAVPSLLRSLAARGALRARASSLLRLRYLMASGGALHDRVAQELEQALPGVTLYVRYGVTELTGAASYVPPEQRRDKRGSIGRGLPGAPLRVQRADGRPVIPGAGEIGEIVVAGPSVALGYFGAPDGTEHGFRAGAFYTGDLATVDADGFVFIVGRDKEFVKIGGHRVAPQEVEEVLLAAPGVLEVGVCGVPHETRGEVLVAVAILDPHQPATVDALHAHCAASLPPHKVPLTIHIDQPLPKTASGKVARKALSLQLQRSVRT